MPQLSTRSNALRLTPLNLALCTALTILAHGAALAQIAPTEVKELATVDVSADASAEGLSKAYPGGQVARGGRAGILGTKDNQDTPFSITSYTNELIQDRQAKSVGEVLQNDPTVRLARGYGNFQEAYFIRGSILSSDDTAFNGLYSLLPRQYIAAELFERVEVLRGASAFLNGASPGGGGIGGALNLLPKRAPNEDLNRVTVGVNSGGGTSVSADLSRRFGPDNATGVRLNLANRDGGTGVDNEKSSLSLVALGLDWHNSNVRLSADLGMQDQKLKSTRSNVTMGFGVTSVPDAPAGNVNTAQPWSYSNEKDTFAVVRGEYDINDSVTAWAAMGTRRGEEANILGNLTITNAATGDGYTSRWDNTGVETVQTYEVGVRGKLRTGSVGHEWVVSASSFNKDRANAYAWNWGNTQNTNLYNPVYLNGLPAFVGSSSIGGDLNNPNITAKTHLDSLAVGDTLALAGDSVLLTLGARQQTLKADNFTYGAGLPDGSYNKTITSPMAGVVYKASKQLSVYGNYVEGLVSNAAPTNGYNRSGNWVAVTNGGAQLDPQVSKQKEVGLKYDAGYLAGSLAYFSTNKPHYVIDSSNTYSASGEDQHQGVELTMQGLLTRDIRLLGGATWLDAIQKSAYLAAADGKRVIGVPTLQANVGAEWEVTSVPGLALDGRVLYTGSTYADAANTLQVPSWTRLDVGARYMTEVMGKLVTLRGRIDNLTDKHYWASSGGYPDNGYLVVGAPRTLNISATVDF